MHPAKDQADKSASKGIYPVLLLPGAFMPRAISISALNS